MEKLIHEFNKEWFFFAADQREAQRCFEDEQDFLTYIYLLGWKSGIRRHYESSTSGQDVEEY
jgi:hypothetical protein